MVEIWGRHFRSNVVRGPTSIGRVIVTVRLFAILRERAGRDALELELPEGATTSDALSAVGEHSGLRDIIERMPLAVAVNRDYASEDRKLADGDEIALVPPVSGGADPQASSGRPGPSAGQTGGEPRGKAGGYAIQGAGSIFVSRVEGSLSNVVGLPLREVLEALDALDRGSLG